MKKINVPQVESSNTNPLLPLSVKKTQAKALTEADLNVITGGLQEEFAAELATLRGRVDSLDE